MAGLAKTNNFMLSTATVMIGLPEELNDLNPTDHSIGLVKNFSLISEPAYTELMQGVKGDIVFSTLTSNPVRASMEVYEYTAKNVAYALGLNGADKTTYTAETTVATPVVASPATNQLVLTSGTGFVDEKYILIAVDDIDNFVIRRITNISTNTLTLDENLPAIPAGAKVYMVNDIDIGSKTEQPFLAAKVVGKLANGKPIGILIPKLRIVKGFNMAFIQNDYANLPFEFTLYDLVSEDVSYATFGGIKSKLFRP